MSTAFDLGFQGFINANHTYALLAQYHNTPLLPPNILHRRCFRFPLGYLHVPGKIANNDYAKFWGVKEVYYGICASRELFKIHLAEKLNTGLQLNN